MIIRTENSNQCHDIYWNLGGLEQPHTQREVLLLIGSRFTAHVVQELEHMQWVLQTSMPVREIPTFVEDLVRAKIPIFEIRKK